MKKTKFNLVGDNFTHLKGGNKGYSTHGKESKNIEWVFDSSGRATFYLDNEIHTAFDDVSDLPKYAWVMEPRPLQSSLYSDIKTNTQNYLDTFELIFTHDQELAKLDSKFKVVLTGFWIKEPTIYKKTKLISMISSNKNFCGGHKKRLEWVERIGDQVDLYGRGFNEIEFKEEGLCDYMFSVAIENVEYASCITEKVLDCFATGTIPIYLGSPDIGNYFNTDGIISLSEEFEISEEIYTSKMTAIKENFERVKQWEVPEDYIWENYLKEKFEIV